MERTCTSLKYNELVVFNIYSDILRKKTAKFGNVIQVYSDTRKVDVSWLEGYKNRCNFIPFEDMLAVHNPDGEMIKFDNIYSKSDLLIPE